MNRESVLRKLSTLLTWICRLGVGGVFLFSGFVKAIDPWGTIYKFHDYLAVFGLPLSDGLVLAGVIMLCVFEFLTGAFLVTGSFRRAAPWMAALLMIVMTPLTLWIAISNPVADCGCFGEALVISNWATFWKNVVVDAGVVWLIMRNRKAHWVITPSLQWLGFLADALFVVTVAVLGYFYQPLIDYRPYKVGEKLIDLADDGAAATNNPEFTFVYEKDGVQKEFGIDDELPDEADGWRFVERKELPSKQSGAQERKGEKALTIYDEETGDDVTAEVALAPGAQFMLFMPALSQVSIASSYQINSLYDFARAHSIGFVAVVSANEDEIAHWRDVSMARYPIYTADDVVIKEVVRGNPAVVYLEDGTVMWKSSLRSLSDDDFLDPGAEQDPMLFAFDNTVILRNIIYLYLAVMAVIILLSFTPALRGVYTRGRRRFRRPEADENATSVENPKPSEESPKVAADDEEASKAADVNKD